MPIVRHLCACDAGYSWRRPEADVDYFERFARFDEHMNRNVHRFVDIGAAAADGGWLTDHGVGHVSTVMQRIGDLTYRNGCFVLSPYETYIVLIAAHIHDVGNVLGREEHENLARETWFGIDSGLIGRDTVEKRMIFDIAMAHGGSLGADGGKDTIGGLRHDRSVRRLAAILRFADELADDYTRTNRFVIEATQTVAPGSAVFHIYADRLSKPQINHDTSSINLTFELQESHLTTRYGKGNGEVYLLDEIMARTLKAHREQVYCSKFMNPRVVSERMEVSILVCTARYAEVLGTVSYVLEQKGYPEGIDDIVQLAPELAALCGRSAASRVGQILAAGLGAADPSRDLIPALSEDP